MIAGLVVYRPTEGGLDGFWIHADTAGKTARETVSGVTLANPEGDWPVDIFDPAGGLIFKGRLSIEPLGESLQLNWSGSLQANGANAAFHGVGRVMPEGLLIATFEKAETAPPS